MLERSKPSQARLVLPRVPPGIVLPVAVQQALDRRPTLVVLRAPRGFGKTSVVSSWIRHQRGRLEAYCWVNLPHTDVSRDQLWAAIFRQLTGSPPDPDLDTWGQLTDELSRMDQPTTVVLDRYDRVGNHGVDDEIMDLLSGFERLRFLILVRTERRIDALAETFADGTVLQMTDLCLTAVDVQVLAQHIGHELTAAEASTLASELGGWPALVRGVLQASGRDDKGRFRPDWSVLDRFCMLVLADPDIAPSYDVVTAMSAPQEFTPALAEVLTGVDVEPRFSPLVQIGLVQRTVIDDQAVYRLRPRVRAAIQKALQHRDPERYRHLHHTLARWFIDQDNPEAGLLHAVEAEAWDTVASLAETYWLEMTTSWPARAAEALAKMPEHLIHSSARLLVARDYIVNVDARRRANSAFRSGQMDVDFSFSGRHDQRLSLAQVLATRSSGADGAARQLIENPGPGAAARQEAWLDDALAQMPELLLQWSITQLLTSDMVGAAYAFREAFRWARDRQLDQVAQEAGSGLALCLALLGHIGQAERWLELVLGPGDAPPDSELERIARYVVTEVLDLDRLTFDHRGRNEDIAAVRGLPAVESIEHHLLGARALHDPTQRRATIVILQKTLVGLEPGGHGAALANAAVMSVLVDLYVATEQREVARQLLDGVAPASGWSTVAHTRLALFEGQWERVMDLTREANRFNATEIRHATQLALMRACAAHRLGLVDRAADSLQTALSLVGHTGSLRPFVLVPRSDLEAISAAYPQLAEEPALLQVMATAAVLPEPPEPIRLSIREIAVLEEIATGQPLSRAARQLFVSENTIKTQVRNIYRKLGVHNREDAIERATALRLLDTE
ncbi:MAG TPA: LuxR C-terminal-related transcriptional regulator [Beutenbergiaceae bacterium]|nr:LuxR C-terminal-related transcriptional regulator [Beutenbergiaceae bacterium]